MKWLKIFTAIIQIGCIYFGIKNIEDADTLRQKCFWIAYTLFFIFAVVLATYALFTTELEL